MERPRESSPPRPQGREPRPPPAIPGHEILRYIKSGAYGDVWLARDTLGTLRAVKVVYRGGFEDGAPYEREFNGLKTFEPVSRLHEGLVDILHVGINAAAECFYYVMELADAVESQAASQSELSVECSFAQRSTQTPLNYLPRTLRSDLKQRCRLPVAECVRIGLSLSSALACMHERGLVHRDIKPSNIIFVGGEPKLADIGLVTTAAEAKTMAGTEGYFPELGFGTPQGDLYSLGKVLYEISTGLVVSEFPALPGNLSDLPDREVLLELSEVFVKACKHDPAQRYQTAAAMQTDLLLLQSGESLRRRYWLRRHRRTFLGTGAVAAIAMMVAIPFMLYQQHQNRRIQQLADENRSQLSRSHVREGERLMNGGNLLGALPWLVEALKVDQGDAERERMHRARLATLLRHCPKLVQSGAHSNDIHYAEFSRDGGKIITASADGTAQIWDAESGTRLTPPLRHGSDVQWAFFNAAGTRAVTISDDSEARVWDTTTGALTFPPLRHADVVQWVTYSVDGRLLVTTSDDKTAQMWDAETGQALGPPLRHAAKIHAAAISRDGTRVATGSHDQTVRVWKVTNGELVCPPMVHGAEVRYVAFSLDGGRIASAGNDAAVRVWETETGRVLTPPLRHTARARQITFSRDGRRLLTTGGLFGNHGEAILWDAHTGEMMLPPMIHAAPVYEGVFTPDERMILTAGSDGTVRLWHAETGELASLIRQHDSIRNATLSPDGRQILTSGRDGIWRVWDLAGAASLTLTLRFNGAVRRAEFSPDGQRLFAASERDGAMIWNASTGEPVASKLNEAGPVIGAYLSPDGSRIACVRTNWQVEVLDAATGETVGVPMSFKGAITDLIFSADGRRLAATGYDRTALVWDARTGKPVTAPLPHESIALSAAFSPDGMSLATGSGVGVIERGPGEARVWLLPGGQLAFPPIQMEASVRNVAFSPDGQRLLISCGDAAPAPRAARIVDARDGMFIGPPLPHSQAINVVTWSRNGQRMATGSTDGVARIWDGNTGLSIMSMSAHRQGIQSLAFSPDGTLLATAGADGAARVWDATTGEPITPPLRHAVVKRSGREGRMEHVAFSPDGRRLVTAGGSHGRDGEVRVWDITPVTQPLEQLERIARLLSGARPDARTGLTGLSAGEMNVFWLNVRSEHPEFFTISLDEKTAWQQQQQAAECEHRGQWHAARFHLQQLLTLKPDDAQLVARLNHAESRGK